MASFPGACANAPKRRTEICTHCGCGEPANRHGNANSITIGDVNKAMKVGAHDKGVKATATEMQRMVRRHAKRK